MYDSKSGEALPLVGSIKATGKVPRPSHIFQLLL